MMRWSRRESVEQLVLLIAQQFDLLPCVPAGPFVFVAHTHMESPHACRVIVCVSLQSVRSAGLLCLRKYRAGKRSNSSGEVNSRAG